MTQTNNAELPTNYQQFIHLSRYARWNEEHQRRETWSETVSRYFDFFENLLTQKHNLDIVTWNGTRKYLEEAVLNLDVMPSMRALMSAGKALEQDNVAGFNCSYLHIDSPRSFDELMYVLMCGTGVGFSVERKFTDKLPCVADSFHATDTTIIVGDSKIGWASAFRELVAMLYAGKVPQWDVTKVRPAGARLKVFGGRASGPEPLVALFEFAVKLFQGAEGRSLTTLECHDLCCKIAEVVVVGGVRRSALISLSNLTDNRMRKAKSGAWFLEEGQRGLANNSVCYT
ncbi:MAG: ribonucleoside-triphosphate reductase, partial [Phycisphaerae bacterium]|nr:ribonucleoside-triphosphate reductase [Phycisphaerae bacterium]